jgi:hypothetical protein
VIVDPELVEMALAGDAEAQCMLAASYLSSDRRNRREAPAPISSNSAAR